MKRKPRPGANAPFDDVVPVYEVQPGASVDDYVLTRNTPRRLTFVKIISDKAVYYAQKSPFANDFDPAAGLTKPLLFCKEISCL